MEGWRLGLKALAIYRDGSKEVQPLSTSSEGQTRRPRSRASPPSRAASACPTPASRSRTSSTSPATRATSPSASIPTAGPGELFITMAKEGSTIGGLMDCFGTAVSMSLQYGVPLEVYVNKFSHTRFEPMGFTKNPDIRIAKSLVDYIFRWLGITFLPGFKEASQGITPGEGGDVGERAERAGASSPPTETGIQGSGIQSPRSPSTKAASRRPRSTRFPPPKPNPPPKNPKAKPPRPPAPLSTQHPAAKTNGHANGHANGHSNGHSEFNFQLLTRAGVLMKDGGPTTARSEQFADFQSDAPACDNCGAITVRNGNCYLCHNCGIVDGLQLSERFSRVACDAGCLCLATTDRTTDNGHFKQAARSRKHQGIDAREQLLHSYLVCGRSKWTCQVGSNRTQRRHTKLFRRAEPNTIG